jgi:putative aldouronate transport system permease protein
MKSRYMKMTIEDRVLDSIVFIVLLAVFVASVYPFFLAIVLSFNEGMDAQLGGIYLAPRKFTLQNYERFFTDPEWLDAIVVTLARTVSGTFLTVFFTTIFAYGLSHKNLMGRKLYMGLLIFAMYFSGGIIPYYAVLLSAGLIDTFAVYIIPTMLNLFFVLVAISFFHNFPIELEEAARVDGAKELRIFFSIVVPIASPLLATLAIFISVQHWNAWYDSAFFVSNPKLLTLAYRMMAVINRADLRNVSAAASGAVSTIRVTPLSVQLAAMTIAVMPILCVYPFFQRYIISGITIGSVKG